MTFRAIRDSFSSVMAAQRHRHQRRNISPEMERSEVPARTPDPRLRPSNVFDDERDMPSSRRDGLALNAKARIEKSGSLLCALRIRAHRSREILRARPRHRTVGKELAGRARDNQIRVAELRTMQGENVLENKLRRVCVALDIESDAIPAFCNQTVCPAS